MIAKSPCRNVIFDADGSGGAEPQDTRSESIIFIGLKSFGSNFADVRDFVNLDLEMEDSKMKEIVDIWKAGRVNELINPLSGYMYECRWRY